jgi:hypothetical protein
MIKKGNKPKLFFDATCKLEVWEMDSFSEHY